MTIGHSVDTKEFLTERAYALSSYVLTYVALLCVFGILGHTMPCHMMSNIAYHAVLLISVQGRSPSQKQSFTIADNDPDKSRYRLELCLRQVSADACGWVAPDPTDRHVRRSLLADKRLRSPAHGATVPCANLLHLLISCLAGQSFGACLLMCTHVCVCVYMYIHIYIYIYTHIRLYIIICLCSYARLCYYVSLCCLCADLAVWLAGWRHELI